jgi:tRNA A-37 threonylcarbamoyl transferase component Bud32
MSFETYAPLAPGRIFNDRYEVIRCINAGGMGAVYEALHLQTQRTRALKVMLPSVVDSDSARARFKLEATVVAAIESDHIAEVIDADVDAETGAPFIVMELLKGEELAALVERVGALGAAEAVTYLRHAAYALDKTHAAGIVHRDLKPENLFVTYRDDGSPRVKVLDFGIAKVLGDVKTRQTQGIIGTPLFMSPEQVHGEAPISAQTDGYALAHIAYNLLVGEPYWAPEEAAAATVMPLLVVIMRGHPEKPSVRARFRCGVTLPEGFDAWFDRAANLDPSARYESALQLVSGLAVLWDDAAIGRATVTPPMTKPLPSTSASADHTFSRTTGAEAFAQGAMSTMSAVDAQPPVSAIEPAPVAPVAPAAPVASAPIVELTPARSTASATSHTVDVALPTNRPGRLVAVGLGLALASVLATMALVHFSASPPSPASASSAPTVGQDEVTQQAPSTSASDEGEEVPSAMPSASSAASPTTSASADTPGLATSELAKPRPRPAVPRPTPAPPSTPPGSWQPVVPDR